MVLKIKQAILSSFIVGIISILMSYAMFGECSGSITEHILCDKIWNGYAPIVGVLTSLTFIIVMFGSKYSK